MKFSIVVATGLYILLASAPAHALQDGRQLHLDCTRGDAYSNGYCEGFIIGVLSAHMSPWVVNLQKGRTYFCIPGKLTSKQVAEAVQKYFAEHPGRQRYRADTTIWTAVTELYPCRE